MNSPLFSGLAKRLVSDAVVSAEDMSEYLSESKKNTESLATYLSRENIVDSLQLALVSSEEFGIPLYDLSSHNPSSMPQDLVSDSLVAKHQVLPLYKRGKRLFIAVTDPSNLAAIDEIKFNTGLNVDCVVVEADKLKAETDRYLASHEETLGETLGGLEDEGLENLDIDTEDPDKQQESSSEEDEAPIVKFVNKILLEAIKTGASDIHFEPYEKTYRIRFRIDGVLSEIQKPPANLSQRLAARLKVMSQMDISERRIPQDGRIQMKLSKKRAIDFRVNTLPTMYGEKIVLRILDPTSAQMGIDALGYEEDQKALYLEALQKPQGMILVTGPTGSGKTVSLYTGLGILNEPERNISTAEDPVEINMAGINQVLVNPKVGLNFAEALRSFLRQDPDVIMVGEIRDLETAEIGIKAAQTGHLVLSTVHTNSAAETVTRLLNMGVPAFNIAASVTLIIAQRLARRLCGHCAELETSVPREALLELGFTADQLSTAEIKRPVGCAQCKDGYKGRVGIYEVVKITKPIASAIMDGANSLELDRVAREAGFNDLRQSALTKCAQGLISLEEVSRVTTD